MPYIGSKPIGRPRLNRAHPHAVGMVAFYLFSEGGGGTVTDLVTGSRGTLTSGPTWGVNPGSGGGASINFASASSQYIDLGQPALLNFNATSAMGVAASYRLPATTPNFTNYILASNGSEWALDVEGPSTGARFYTNNGSGGGFWTEGRAPVVGDNRVAGGSVNVVSGAQAGYLMCEAVPIGFSNPAFASLPTTAVSTQIGMGAGGSGPLNGGLNWVALWNRYIPPDLMASFQRDPFACLRPGPPMFAFAPQAAPPVGFAGWFPGWPDTSNSPTLPQLLVL